MSWQLLRVDKNGTKYWADDTCPRCGGQGGSDAWVYTGWTCYECGGTGKAYKARVIKEYTPEYKAKLDARRLAKARAKSDERNAKFFQQMGMNAEGKAWVVIGNTFEIKDELKEAGAKFGILDWHFDHPDNGYECFEISIEEIAEKDIQYVWVLFDDYFIKKFIKEQKALHAPKTASEYVGNIGDKIEMRLTFKDAFAFETHFTYRGELNHIYKFADDNGNTFTWKTGKWLELDKGTQYTVKGTIKDHNEYKGDKQTVLTRCKVVA